MGITTLPFYIAGDCIEAAKHNSTAQISSLDGDTSLSVAETTPAQLRSALRFADDSQKKLNQTTLRERIAVTKLLMNEYSKKRQEISWGLAKFRGIVAKDSHWMCDVNENWADRLEDLCQLIFYQNKSISASTVTSLQGSEDELIWQSKGKAALFSASTMDGPPGLVAICHGILSGTHLILRPSWRDVVTHYAYEILASHGLSHYGQLVRWRSDSDRAGQLNKLLLQNVAQNVIFSSNETFTTLLSSIGTPGSQIWEDALRKSRRYGTGLPLAIVTPNANLEQAARQLVESARLGTGRFCLSAGPVLVFENCYEQLVDLLIKYASDLKRGDPTDLETDLGGIDQEESRSLKSNLSQFGGVIAYGKIYDRDMDLIILRDVPDVSPCLYQEIPGPILSLVKIKTFDEVESLAGGALKKNSREAWTAITVFGDDQEFSLVKSKVESFRYLNYGVTAKVKLLLPHQGSYFALDLMRRVTLEKNYSNDIKAVA